MTKSSSHEDPTISTVVLVWALSIILVEWFAPLLGDPGKEKHPQARGLAFSKRLCTSGGTYDFLVNITPIAFEKLGNVSKPMAFAWNSLSAHKQYGALAWWGTTDTNEQCYELLSLIQLPGLQMKPSLIKKKPTTGGVRKLTPPPPSPGWTLDLYNCHPFEEDCNVYSGMGELYAWLLIFLCVRRNLLAMKYVCV